MIKSLKKGNIFVLNDTEMIGYIQKPSDIKNHKIQRQL